MSSIINKYYEYRDFEFDAEQALKRANFLVVHDPRKKLDRDDLFQMAKHQHSIDKAKHGEIVKDLTRKYEVVCDELAGNMCGYCWRKMEDEPTEKQSYTQHVEKMLHDNNSEIATLKSKLDKAVSALKYYAEESYYDGGCFTVSEYRAQDTLKELGD